MYRDWKPTETFADLRRELEGRHGGPAGTRQFIRVLQLLAEHPQARVARAIAVCRAGHTVSAEAIAHQTRALAKAETDCQYNIGSSDKLANLHLIAVPPPDLSRFNRLLGGDAPADGGPSEEREQFSR